MIFESYVMKIRFRNLDLLFFNNILKFLVRYLRLLFRR